MVIRLPPALWSISSAWLALVTAPPPSAHRQVIVASSARSRPVSPGDLATLCVCSFAWWVVFWLAMTPSSLTPDAVCLGGQGNALFYHTYAAIKGDAPICFLSNSSAPSGDKTLPSLTSDPFRPLHV